MTILTGSEFKELAAKSGWELVKYLNSNDLSRPQLKHHNFCYTLGENIIPPEEVVLDIDNPCSSGGLYFTYVESNMWTRRHCFHVTVSGDASVLIESDDKFKTDKLILLNEADENWYIKNMKLNSYWLHNVKNQTEDICVAAVEEHGIALQYVIDQTEKICMAAVSIDGYALRYVKNQTEAICMAAVENSAFALQFAKDQTKDMCLVAIKDFGFAILFVRNQTEDMCLEAVKLNICSLQFVKNQTEAICIAAVQTDGYALRFVKNQTEAIRMAVKNNPDATDL